jgi:hypothetical protein
MKRLTTLAAALLIAAPLLAADAPKTDTTQTATAAPQDSPLVAAAKKAAKKRTGKTVVITNETLLKVGQWSNANVTTTDSQPAITLPNPDAALIAMQQKAEQQQTESAAPAQPSPAEAERQKRANERAAHAEEAGPYSETPYVDEMHIAAAQQQQPATATTQSPESMQDPKKP